MIEREVENLLEQDLKDNGYIIDTGSAQRNIYRQDPRSSEEKVLLKGKHPDFIIYEDNNSKCPIAIIETKKTEYRTLEKALEQVLDYADKLKAKIVFLYNGNRYLSYWVETKENLFIDNIEVDKILPLEILQKFKSNKIFLANQIQINNKNDLINVFKEANNKLRDAGITIGLGRFTEFSNLLFLKLISEKNTFENNKIPNHLLWDTYKNKDGDELLLYINEVVIPGLNNQFKSTENIDLFSKLKLQDPVRLKYIIDKLDKINLSTINTDIKGDAFEYFIEKYNSTNNDLGEYFTPRHLVSFLVSIMDPRYPEKVYDPFCGTGGMLIASFEHIKKNLHVNGILNEETLDNLRKKSLYGSEISDTARIAKMNMILTGDGHTNIIKQDSFTHPVNQKYDVVITNIPFNLSANKQQAEPYKYKIEKGNALAIQHVLKSLNSNINARAAVIVPEIVLNDVALKNLREYMIKNGNLKGVISLPSKVFMPYTEAKTSILILGGNNTPSNDRIFFYKVKNDGYTLTTRRRKKFGINDLDEFINCYQYLNQMKENENLTLISRDEILANREKSLLLFKYRDVLKKGYIRLEEVLEKVRVPNLEMFETASITKQDFWGMPCGNDFWGENFISVTSNDNSNYSVVEPNWLSFNPARANIGSFGINVGNIPVSVTNAYPVFKVKNDKFIPKYIYLLIRKNQDIIDEIINRSYGTVRQSLSAEEFLKIQIPIVDLEEQKRIVNEVTNIYSKIKNLTNELDNYQISDKCD